MTVLSVILGILLIICGISCMFTPFATFMSIGYYIAALLLVYGIMYIVRAAVQKNVSAPGIVTSILAIIVGILSIVRPGSALVIDGVILYCIAFWYLLQGIVSCVTSVRLRKLVKSWYWGLISGILGIVVGVIFLLFPLVGAFTAGFMVGFAFLQAGIQMIVFAFMRGD